MRHALAVCALSAALWVLDPPYGSLRYRAGVVLARALFAPVRAVSALPKRYR